MEKNYINWQGNSCYYVDLINKEYGVRISVKDTPKANEIIKSFRNKRKQQINYLKQEWAGGVA